MAGYSAPNTITKTTIAVSFANIRLAKPNQRIHNHRQNELLLTLKSNEPRFQPDDEITVIFLPVIISVATVSCKDPISLPTYIRMKNLFPLLLLVSVVGSAFAQSKTLLNLDRNSLAIQGYDPVAFFTDNKPVKGDSNLSSSYKGANYLFASKEHKDLFDKEPSKYEPAFGGYCAFGVSRNKLVEIDPEAFQIVQGRLLPQYSN